MSLCLLLLLYFSYFKGFIFLFSLFIDFFFLEKEAADITIITMLHKRCFTYHSHIFFCVYFVYLTIFFNYKIKGKNLKIDIIKERN